MPSPGSVRFRTLQRRLWESLLVAEFKDRVDALCSVYLSRTWATPGLFNFQTKDLVHPGVGALKFTCRVCTEQVRGLQAATVESYPDWR